MDEMKKGTIEKAIDEYENIMGIKLSESQRIIFTAGYTFALIENDLIPLEDKDGK
jgi:hypothetical protein